VSVSERDDIALSGYFIRVSNNNNCLVIVQAAEPGFSNHGLESFSFYKAPRASFEF